jgi:acyl-coenzyme A synthetase/AMP-(fatty) acid ligase
MFIKPEEDLSDTDTLERDLRELLTEHFPSVALPKHWRFLEEVPEDQLGKPQYDELRSQLDRT